VLIAIRDICCNAAPSTASLPRRKPASAGPSSEKLRCSGQREELRPVLKVLSRKYRQFNVHGTVHRYMCILYNQRYETYTMFFIIVSAVHVSGGISAHHQEHIKLYVQPWVLSCFPAVYRWCGLVGTIILVIK
jgi:hypothetical protein